MNATELKFLNSPEGESLLTKIKNMKEADRYKYLCQVDILERANVAAALSLMMFRQKAKDKFTLAENMFFTSLGLEQSSGEKVANHIAKRFKKDWTVADITCGVGGNLVALAQQCQHVIAVEKEETTLECAKFNIKAHNLGSKAEFFQMEAEAFLQSKASDKVDAFFLDPARDREGMTKTRSILNSSPNLLEILPLIFKKTKNIGVKISPAFDWREIDLLPGEPEVEVISEDNVCKVAMLWFGDLKKGTKSATCFRKNADFFFSDSSLAVSSSEKENFFKLELNKRVEIILQPLKYIFEADKAIVRAGLLDAFANLAKMKKIDAKSQYLSADEIMIPAGRVLKIEKTFDASLRELKKELKKLSIEKADISAKNYFIKPEEIYKKLKIKEGGDYVLIFTALPGHKNGIILAKKFVLC